MAHTNTLRLDSFACPTALQSLRDLVRWLALRQSWEESFQLSLCDSVARRWGVFPHEDCVYVQVVTGMNGQDLLKHFPGLSTLPVTPGEQTPATSGDLCDGHAFFFGPFSEEFSNL